MEVPMKTGIICAGDSEFFPFLDYLTEEKVTEKAMLHFHEGKIAGRSVVVLYSGVCKVNAAIAAQLLIDTFRTDLILNAGTAGGIAGDVRLFDTIAAERTAYHDVDDDILTDFHPWMKSIYFDASPMLLDLARRVSAQSPHPIRFGTTVTGEQFINNPQREAILDKYHPLAVDMESASIAHVCYVNRIPFLSLRTITDTALHEGQDNFEKNCEKASRICAGLTVKLLGLL